VLVFVIALKSREISHSWDLMSRLVERCLRSICNQSCDHFEVVLVCNQRPHVSFENDKIHYVEVDYPIPKGLPEERERLKGYEHTASLDIARKNADKTKKLLKGIEFAQRFNPTHIMVVDADDCVSRHLAQFVQDHAQDDGWYMNEGYMYREGSKYVYIKVSHFNHVSGTSFIIRSPLYSLLFQGEENYQCAVERLAGAMVKPLPFRGAVYSMLNGENILMSAQTFTQMRRQVIGSVPRLVERLRRYRLWWLTPSIRQEFGLYAVTADRVRVPESTTVTS
jgi:hypothetical protein